MNVPALADVFAAARRIAGQADAQRGQVPRTPPGDLPGCTLRYLIGTGGQDTAIATTVFAVPGGADASAKV